LPDVAARAAGYGIPGIVVDGNDVFAVYQAANAAVDRARPRRPTLIECKTYLARHTRAQRATRSARSGEREAWLRKDRSRCSNAAPGTGELDDAGLRSIEGDIMAALEAAIAFARQAVSATRAGDRRRLFGLTHSKEMNVLTQRTGGYAKDAKALSRAQRATILQGTINWRSRGTMPSHPLRALCVFG